jgi:F-type H+-transporting ATPase subunit a
VSGPLLPVLASRDIVGHLTNSYTVEFVGVVLHLDGVNAAVKSATGFDPHLNKHVVMMMAAATVVSLLVLPAARRIAAGGPRGLVGNCLESTAIFLKDQVVEPGIGHHHAKAFFPLFATFFFFILSCNLLGLLPQSATATGNHHVTLALALVTLGTMLAGGMAVKGVFGYWTSIVPHGVPLWMWPIIWPIEMMGHFTKPFALTVRLFANMTAGHVVLAVLAGFLVAEVGAMVKPLIVVPTLGFALFIMVFEVLVAFIQAYIFTTLSSIFVGLCLSHDH